MLVGVRVWDGRGQGFNSNIYIYIQKDLITTPHQKKERRSLRKGVLFICLYEYVPSFHTNFLVRLHFTLYFSYFLKKLYWKDTLDTVIYTLKYTSNYKNPSKLKEFAYTRGLVTNACSFLFFWFQCSPNFRTSLSQVLMIMYVYILFLLWLHISLWHSWFNIIV